MNKNHTHEKKVDHTSEFPSGIYWWTLKNLKNQNFVEMKKKKLLEISLFHKCTKSHNHMKYSSWDTELDRFFLVILGHFGSFFALLPPTLLATQKTKILKKGKTASEGVIILNLYNKKHDHMMYDYSDMVCNRHIFCILGNFLLFYSTIGPKN